LLTPWHR